jgi:hypothetical protein
VRLSALQGVRVDLGVYTFQTFLAYRNTTSTSTSTANGTTTSTTISSSAPP